METSRLKVLMSAYGCGPGRGSEPGVGWNWVQTIARRHDVWVLVPESERSAIEAAIEGGIANRARFVFTDMPRWRRFANQTTVRYHLHYLTWQIHAYFVARRLNREIGFDVTHHVTVGAHWRPTLLSLLPVPLIWGPVGGGEHVPRGFRSSLCLRAQVYEFLRWLIQRVHELDPSIRVTARRARIALAKTELTRQALERLGSRNAMVYSEAGLSEEELEALTAFPIRRQGPFRLLSLGRLIDWKGIEFGVRAFAKMRTSAEYWIIGDGAARNRIASVAGRLGVSDRVTFLGRLPREECLRRIAECDVLVHPSLHDSGGWVCLEAMAAGRPVVCLDWGGPGTQVTHETGFKIRPVSPEQAVMEMAAALDLLAEDGGLRERMATAGRRHVRERYSWESKAADLWGFYEQAVPGTHAGEAAHA